MKAEPKNSVTTMMWDEQVEKALARLAVEGSFSTALTMPP
jgi:hypothetical protein